MAQATSIPKSMTTGEMGLAMAVSRKRRVSNIWHSVPKPKQRLGHDSAPLGQRGALAAEMWLM